MAGYALECIEQSQISKFGRGMATLWLEIYVAKYITDCIPVIRQGWIPQNVRGPDGGYSLKSVSISPSGFCTGHDLNRGSRAMSQ
ncbi:hypothetical protein ACFX2J_043922 [Malus domestica]